ncbi:hypothetical protein TK0103 [Thermococcus kodakarensis KOD1]|uniref:Uncharacterized protein n=1 Tax=Thermococcus kodakarensis (strain ATCC BAA-918 / JCM 12380 / KOD1) TaxID=69014 RepID=Q5JFF0_THEKO|nr:hypothetical protein [Thermococcus kodakarensis]WCN28217.1 hypothetical protein POG15_00545 [Thermococcus kodakarensis]WCN30514.1 hypothetical protein POG21_00545 [Thermococcus kodakarensis]BAD84292.1 hypothetical protein TK0103 [Thermococcus kodakarensis KOD1]
MSVDLSFVNGFIVGAGATFFVLLVLAHIYGGKIDIKRTGVANLYFGLAARKAVRIEVDQDKAKILVINEDVACSIDFDPSEFKAFKKALLKLGPEVEERDVSES